MHALPRSLMTTALATLAIVSVPPAQAARPTFTQELNIETVPCEGLAVDGARYSYRSGDTQSVFCEAGTAGPTTSNILPPALQFGAGGVLEIRFDVPTTSFGFGVAQLSDQPLLQSVVVDLFGPGGGKLRKRQLLDNFLDPEFAGGRFEYRGPAIGAVTIRIANETSGRPVAIDNVTYARPVGRGR